MEAFLHKFLAVCSLVLALYCTVRALYSLWWKPKALEKRLREQGIAGNAYRFLVGDMIEEAKATRGAYSRPMDRLTHRYVPRVLPFLHRTLQRYGKGPRLIWSGTTPKVVISDLKLVNRIFLNKSGHVNRPVPSPFISFLRIGVLGLDGQELASRRKMIGKALHLEKLREMVPTFQTTCDLLIKRWDDLARAEGSCEVDVWPELQKLTGDVISRTVFGSCYEEGKRIFQLQKEQFELIVQCARLSYIPGFRLVPTARNKRITWADKEIRFMIRSMIDKKSTENGGPDCTNLLSLLVHFSNHNDEQCRLTNEEVIDECKHLYYDGQPIAGLLTWAMVCLSMHPTWQQRAREEVLAICGKNAPNFETISRLKTVTMILHEVQRLYPVVPHISRHAYKDIKLGDLSIPAGTDLSIPVMLIHRDPEYWGEDAEEFNPGRFSEGILKASVGDKNAFFPFGWGERKCLGQTFALIEAKITLATILQHFSFELSLSYAHAPYTLLMVQPQYGAHLILHRLSAV